ncbi:MAG: DUF885 family protein [Nanoarchaeota archaeon]
MKSPKKDVIIESLIADFHKFFTETPEERLLLGITEDVGSLSSISEEGHQESIKEGKQLLYRLRNFSPTELSFDQKLDLELAVLALEQQIFNESYTINGRPIYKVMPDAGDLGDGILRLLINDPRPSHERYDDITGRLKDIPRYLNEILKGVDLPVQRWADIDIESVKELPELFKTVSKKAEDENYHGLTKLNRVIEKAGAALKDYVIQLTKMKTTPHFAIGAEQAKELVRLRGIDLSFDQMQGMAKDFLQDTSLQLEDLRQKLVSRYSLSKETTVDKLHAFLNDRYAVPLEKTLDAYGEERKKVVDFISYHDLFPIPQNQEMLIIKTPQFLENLIPAGAMDSPPPFTKGTKKSVIYLTLNKDLVDEHTRLKIPMMIIHEGIPGHHLQFSSAFENPSTARKHWGEAAMDLAEGWTTMLEDYMLDVGYMDDLKDEARFCAKLELRRFGARVAIDLYFMTGEKDYLNVGVDANISSSNPFINAGNLLRKVTGFTSHRTRSELNWYSQTPGYPLSYLVGNKLVWKLKEDFAAAQKGKLSGLDLDRKFHETYLQAGCMPLKYLRRVFEHQGYISKK